MHVLFLCKNEGNFNPLPSHEGRRDSVTRPPPSVLISIHSPHTRGDSSAAVNSPFLAHFNPLPSHEGRQDRKNFPNWLGKFQSTPLTRGETAVAHIRGHFHHISIHSPHTRGDKPSRISGAMRSDFNPLPSHEGRRGKSMTYKQWYQISIHSPHTRGDRVSPEHRFKLRISIHSPHTRGDPGYFGAAQTGEFQSTPLTRGETA